MASTFLSLSILYITHLLLVTESLLNVALYKPAHLSSVYSSIAHTADSANDGYVDNRVSNGHCAHSATNNPGWWMVDLRGLYMVEQIVLVNRGEDPKTSKRTRNFTFDVFQTDPRMSSDFPMKSGQVCYKRLQAVGQGETLTQNCTTPILGRFVRLIRPAQHDTRYGMLGQVVHMNIFKLCWDVLTHLHTDDPIKDRKVDF